MRKIAIIGAGLSGLTAAHYLAADFDITLFEKSRGVGGRITTRRAEPFFFDHGAQFFKVTHPAFQDFIAPLCQKGVIQRWDAEFVEIDGNRLISKRKWSAEHPHYVAVPGMNAFCKEISKPFKMLKQTEVQEIEKQHDKWDLRDIRGEIYDGYDLVILTAPAHQSKKLLGRYLHLYPEIQHMKMSACFSLMLGFDHLPDLPFEAALVKQRVISWISVNSSKPERIGKPSILVHSTNLWADLNLESDSEKVTAALIAEACDVMGVQSESITYQNLHRWRYANIGKQSTESFFFDANHQIGLCGDWFQQGRVQSAFLSGYDLAQKIRMTSLDEAALV